MPSEFLRDFAFEKLIRPVAPDAFFNTYWERKPLHVGRSAPPFYGDLLTAADLETALTAATDSFGLARNSEDGAYTVEYAGSAAEVSELTITGLRGGDSLVLLDAQDRLSNLGLICRLLAREFAYQVHSKVFLTPAGCKAFKPHYDRYDAFILQVLGSKSWRVEKYRRKFPRPEEHDRGDTELSRYRNEFRLDQGDFLYIPRGYVHAAEADDAVSMHITLTVEPPTWEDLLHAVVKRAADREERFKHALPAGFLSEPPDRLAAGLAKLAEAMTAPAHLDDVAGRFADEYVTRFAPDIAGHLAAFVAGDSPAPDEVVGPRRGLIYRLGDEDGSVVLLVGARRIAFPELLADQLRFALETPSFTVRDLPGDLTDDEKAVFIERLVQEGLVERKDPVA